MGDLNRGAASTFVAGETMTAAKLHKLIDDAELKSASVTTAKLADGSVTDAKLAAGITITAAKVTLPDGNIMLGNSSNVGAHLPVGATITKTGTLDVADGAIATAKLADGATTTAKIATLSPSPAGTHGSGSMVPVLTVNDKGQVTGVTTAAVSVATLTKTWSSGVSFPGRGAATTIAHSGGANALVEVFAECVSDNQGYLASVPHRVPLWAFFTDDGSNDFPAFSVAVGPSGVDVVRNDDVGGVSSHLFILHRSDGRNLEIDETKWVLKACVIA